MNKYLVREVNVSLRVYETMTSIDKIKTKHTVYHNDTDILILN
jgi:hypothetical protein